MNERQALGKARGVLLDWDGCVAVNNAMLPGAEPFIARNAGRVAIVSNNSTHLPADIAEILAGNGIAFPADRIFLAGVEALRTVASSGVRRVMLCAVPGMRRFARSLGLSLVHDNPEAVVLMRDAHFTYEKLERAANAVRHGARLVVANADRNHPGAGNRVVPETGALLAALLACAGDQAVKPCIVGKPSPMLFERACEGLGIASGDAVMIGDNPETDGAGAARLGIRPVLIGGASRLSLLDLLEPVPA